LINNENHIRDNIKESINEIIREYGFECKDFIIQKITLAETYYSYLKKKI